MTRVVELDSAPALATLVAEVQASGEPVSLCSGGREVAVVKPPRKRPPRRRAPSEADIAAFLASAGSWADFDDEAFRAAMKESRSIPSRVFETW